jgi:mRNA interferase MazF
MYKRGEIVLVPVPFSDLSASKKRPVLVLSNTAHNLRKPDIVVLAITSNLRQEGLQITSDSLVSGVLPKVSIVRHDKIYTLDQDIVVKRIGVLRTDLLESVAERVFEVLSEG